MALNSGSLSRMASCFSPFKLTSSSFFTVLVIAFSCLLVWRLWRFSLAPNFGPNQPKQLPYWIPLLGHAFQFVKDPQSVFAQGQKLFGRVGRPYSLTVAGRTLYILLDPQDFNDIYRNANIFTFDPLLEQVYQAFQLPEKSIRRLYRIPSASSKSSGPLNFSEKNVLNNSPKLLHVQLRGKQAHFLALKAKRQLDSMMSLGRVCSILSTTGNESSTVVSLFKLCSVMVTAAGQASYFGNALHEIDPSLPETFLTFDKFFWQFFYRPKLFWNKRLKTCKTRLLKALETYSRKPMEQRQDMPQFLQDWENECKKSGLNDSEVAIILLLQYVGVNTNTPKACFWLLCHILFNRELAQIVRDETRAAFTSEVFDYDIIERSQLLHGIWLETLRLCSSSLTFRHITRDFDIKGLRLRKGNLVVINPRPLHIDAECFGEDPLDFIAKRFVGNVGYQRHPAFRPFGGGEAQCPGRQIAKQTALTFVAYVLHEFDVDLAWPQRFPRPSRYSYPGVAVLTPMEGDDLFVRLTERGKE